MKESLQLPVLLTCSELLNPLYKHLIFVSIQKKLPGAFNGCSFKRL